MYEPIAKQWIAALRSGKYAQAKGALRTRDGFCCLGVLCDLKGVEWEPAGLNEEKDDAERFLALGETAILPSSIKRWAGLYSDSGVIPSLEIAGRNYQLAAMNDDGKTFGEIADIIETHWAEL